MAKDPAILFYTSDFLTGTITMTDEQVGKYIRLLCIQHQKGFLTKKDMLSICKTHDQDIFDKFTQNGDDRYYNKRMAEEAEKRKRYSESRRSNALNPKKDKSICKAYAKHMENENENEDLNRNIDDIISFLNIKTGKNFKSNTDKTKKHIHARIREGFTLEDFKKVITNRCEKWLADPKMNEYLRPETLFGTKFESYLNDARQIKKPKHVF